MASKYVIPAEWDHIDRIARLMRESDKQEAWASVRQRPVQALEAYTVINPKTKDPIAMFGVGSLSLLSDTGVIWLAGTDEIRKWRTPFAKHSRVYIKAMLDNYSMLESYVDARNDTSIAWLKWCGFKIFEAEPLGPDNTPFHRVELKG